MMPSAEAACGATGAAAGVVLIVAAADGAPAASGTSISNRVLPVLITSPVLNEISVTVPSNGDEISTVAYRYKRNSAIMWICSRLVLKHHENSSSQCAGSHLI